MKNDWTKIRSKVKSFIEEEIGLDGIDPVSYTHLTLPTNREV